MTERTPAAVIEATAEALSAVHSILKELLEGANLPPDRRAFHQRDLAEIEKVVVWLDPQRGPNL